MEVGTIFIYFYLIKIQKCKESKKQPKFQKVAFSAKKKRKKNENMNFVYIFKLWTLANRKMVEN